MQIKQTGNRRQAGFTLVEVMLAISITAFLAVLAYQGLSAAAISAERHEKQIKLLSDIQLPLTVLERDIRHIVARSIRDELGSVQPAVRGGEFNDYPLVLTRRGWDNPRGLPRGELQRVRYVLENDELWRESWSVLDRVSEEGGQRRTLLLKGVTELKLLFLSNGGADAATTTPTPLGGEWLEDWQAVDQLPVAIDISMEIEHFGQVRRVFGIQGY